MLTPGIAGSLTMMIANTLSAALGWPPSSVGLVFSFLLGTLLVASGVGLWSKIVYYVVNSLIIFCMAFGTANIAANAGTRDPSGLGAAFSLIGSAYAGEAVSDNGTAKSATLTQAEVTALLEALKEATATKDPNDPAAIAAREQIAKALQELRSPAPAVQNTASRPFFQQWKF
jgi:hypothetical protein